MLGALNHLQHARGRTVVFIAILERSTDDFNTPIWQPQLEGAKTTREIGGIVDQIVSMVFVDFGDQKPIRTLVCKSPNSFGYPAKDRSGKLEMFEPPDLGRLFKKIVTSPRAPKESNHA
jgi:hypothetical protein